MPNVKSSKKAVKVIAKKTEENHELKARVNNLIKACEKEIKANNVEEANKKFKELSTLFFFDKIIYEVNNEKIISSFNLSIIYCCYYL